MLVNDRGKDFVGKLSNCQKQSSKKCNSLLAQNLAALPHFPNPLFYHLMFAHLRKERTPKLILCTIGANNILADEPSNCQNNIQKNRSNLLAQIWQRFRTPPNSFIF
jgi:hypothetical protein